MKTSKTNCSDNDATLDQNARCSTMFSKLKLGSTDFTVMSVHSHTHDRTFPQHSSDHSTDHGGMQPPGENSSKKTSRLPFKRLQSVTGQDRRTHARNHRRGGGRGAKTKLARKKQTHRKQWTTSIVGQHYPCAHQPHMQTDKLQCRTSRIQKMMRIGSFGLCRCTLLKRSCSRNWNCKHGPSVDGRKSLLNITELVKL